MIKAGTIENCGRNIIMKCHTDNVYMGVIVLRNYLAMYVYIGIITNTVMLAFFHLRIYDQ